MRISPENHVLRLAGETPVSVRYTVDGTFEDGHVEDVTTRVQLALADAALGSFAKGTLTGSTLKGGVTSVKAQAGKVAAETGVTLLMAPRVNAPDAQTLPANAHALFGGAEDATRKPQFVYPNDGVLVPPNLGKLEFHFLPGKGNTVFELTLSNAVTDLKVYLDCTLPMNGGCIYQPTRDVWTWLAETNRGDSVTATLKGTDESGMLVGTSAPLRLRFSKDDLRGGLYYWTTTEKAIIRFDFGPNGKTEGERFLTSDIANGRCIGCHALSRDGSKMVVQVDGSGGGATGGQLALVDVATRSNRVAFPAAGGGNNARAFFLSWNPDGSQFVGSWSRGDASGELRLFDGNNASLLGTIPGTGAKGSAGNHPDWSPDGRHIAYQRSSGTRRPDLEAPLQYALNGAIHVVSKTSDGAGWQPPVEVAPAVPEKNRFYPAIAPDSTYLVFNESTCTSGTDKVECDGDGDPSATLYAAALKPGAQLVRMSNANAGGMRDADQNLTNSFPKWSPFVFDKDGSGTKLHFMTFSSSRKYGLRDHPEPPEASSGKLPTYLWMTAVEPEKLARGEDPSAPAFFLPFQDLATSNHIAQWTEKARDSLQ